MSLIIPSLINDELGDIYLGNKQEIDDVIVHLKDHFGQHLNGYSLLRIGIKGLCRFKRIGRNANRNGTDYTFRSIDIDCKGKLWVDGVDIL